MCLLCAKAEMTNFAHANDGNVDFGQCITHGMLHSSQRA
jgi:hypothetical protein